MMNEHCKFSALKKRRKVNQLISGRKVNEFQVVRIKVKLIMV